MTDTEALVHVSTEQATWGAASALDELLYLTDKRLSGVRRGIAMEMCGIGYTERLVRLADRVLACDDASWTGVQTRVVLATGSARRAA